MRCSRRQLAFAAATTLLPLISLSCKQPIQPLSSRLAPLDASASLRAIQADEERLAEQVHRLARAQAGQELEAALKLARSPQVDQRGKADAGQVMRAPDTELAGKLERATPTQIMIRDNAGFEYWLRANEATQVTLNGQPARLTDFKQGTDVRAQFFWQGKERFATAVDVLGSGETGDGGVAPLPSGS